MAVLAAMLGVSYVPDRVDWNESVPMRCLDVATAATSPLLGDAPKRLSRYVLPGNEALALGLKEGSVGSGIPRHRDRL